MWQKYGVMLIHGTFGSPDEYRELQDYLEQHGYHTLTPSLPAHGERLHESFGQLCADEILQAAWSAYQDFSQTCDQVVVMGHSLGGLCSLWLAGQRPEKLQAVITIGAPYEYGYWVNYTHGLLKVPVKKMIKGIRYLPQGRTGCKAPTFYPWWFPRLYRESQPLFEAMQSGLQHIQVPVFLMHAVHDLIVPYEEMHKIKMAITEQELVTHCDLHHCGHQVFPYSQEKYQVMQRIHEYLNQQCSARV